MRERTKAEIVEEFLERGHRLTHNEVVILQALSNGRLWSYEALADRLWGQLNEPSDPKNNLQVYLHRIRSKGADVVNYASVGYRWEQ